MTAMQYESSWDQLRQGRSIPIAVMDQVLKDQAVKPLAKCLFFTLVSESDAIGEIRSLSKSQLSAMLSCDVKTTEKALQQLEAGKYVIIERGRNGSSLKFRLTRTDGLLPWQRRGTEGVFPDTRGDNPSVGDNQPTNQTSTGGVGVEAGLRRFKKMLKSLGPEAAELLAEADDLFNSWCYFYPNVDIISEVRYSLDQWTNGNVEEKHRRKGVLSWIESLLRFTQKGMTGTDARNPNRQFGQMKEGKKNSKVKEKQTQQYKTDPKLKQYLNQQTKDGIHRAA